MFTRVHHMGFVVNDLDWAVKVLGDACGLKIDEERCTGGKPRYDEAMKADVLEFPMGNAAVFVYRPRDPDTDMGRFLAQRGAGGAHHVSLVSDQPDYDLSRIVGNGVKLQLPPRKSDWDGKSPVFLDPDTTYGLTVQVWPRDNYVPSNKYRGENLFSKMHHVGVGARSFEEAKHFWVDIMGIPVDMRRSPLPRGRGAEPGTKADPTRPASDPVQLLDMPVGETEIEISVPTDPDSGTGRFVQRNAARGMGLHHICPYSHDPEKACSFLVAQGMQMIGTLSPGQPGSSRVGWFHPKSILGVLMEIWHDVPPTVE